MSSPGEGTAGAFLTAGREVSGSENGLGMAPAHPYDTRAPVNAMLRSERMVQRMAPNGSLFADLDARHDFDFLTLRWLVFCRQHPHRGREQARNGAHNDEETD
jgi:hypothetical protein